MMASVMNSALLQSSLEKIGVQARLQTAISVQGVGEPYNRQRATRHLDKGRVVIFGGIGATLGNPLLSSDASAALRAIDSTTLLLPLSVVLFPLVTGPKW
jgi:uridylate kinase